jgi:hypothetical protein
MSKGKVVPQVCVLVLGDGPNEVGTELDSPLPPSRLPALPRLIHRLVDEPSHACYRMRLFVRIPHGNGKGDAYEKKAKAAIALARELGCQAVVILRDRDRARTVNRLRPLQRGRDAAAIDGTNPPCAVGLAVETFDAWMIADGKAVAKATDCKTGRSHPSPEGLRGQEQTGDHPKDWARELFGGLDAMAEAYPKVAASVNIAFLETACPEGFAPFAEEVRQRIGPVMAGS